MTTFIPVTEQESPYRHLEQMSIREVLDNINKEDQTVARAVELTIPQIEPLVKAITDKMVQGGRLFYIGAGSSGRLGVLDASEIPPTYGMPAGLVIAIIAGGDDAIRNAVEMAEDNNSQGWKDLESKFINKKDIIIGIAASGTTPYVLGALQKCRKQGITTASVCCNKNTPISNCSDYPVEVLTGPEFVTGSTRMKAATAEKMILNMISTAVMIQLGRVEDNKMVNMQLSNNKLIERSVKIVMERTGIEEPKKAKDLLIKYGSVKKVIEEINLMGIHNI